MCLKNSQNHFYPWCFYLSNEVSWILSIIQNKAMLRIYFFVDLYLGKGKIRVRFFRVRFISWETDSIFCRGSCSDPFFFKSEPNTDGNIFSMNFNRFFRRSNPDLFRELDPDPKPQYWSCNWYGEAACMHCTYFKNVEIKNWGCKQLICSNITVK